MFTLVVVVVTTLYVVYRFLTPRRPLNFPPGPREYPLAGGAWILGKLDSQFPLAMMKLEEIYGPVTGIYLGKMRSIIVNGYESAKEVLTRDEFQGRPYILFNELSYGDSKLGLMFSDGELWKQQRRFTMRHLRDFGFGKSSMEEIIKEETRKCLNALKSKMKDGVVSLNDAFGPAVINVLWTIVAGKRYEHNDPKFLELLQCLHRLFSSVKLGDGNPIQDYPFLRFIPPFSKKFKYQMSCHRALTDMLEKEILDHENDRSEEYSRDFMDLYLRELDILTKAANVDHHFSKPQLKVICSDLFSAGSETTSNFVSFCMLYMMLYPEVQGKVYTEISNVVGKEELPSYFEHRARLPYTEAVLCEITRVANVAPTTAPHCTLQDTRLNGYDIPKDTFVLVMLNSVHLDKKYWGDPQYFRPERFLNEKGNLVKTERLMGFGFGKRICLGEVLARANIFHLFTAMLQTFKIEKVPNTEEPTTVPIQGVTLAPQPFNAMLSLR